MDKKNLNIKAVVVTYNRKTHLKECLESLLKQTLKLSQIIVIDNASTDGTQQYLTELKFLDDPRIQYVLLPSNRGGAYGFYEGVKRACTEGCDWVWLMDDDVQPTHTALQVLIEKIDIVKERLSFTNRSIGFACSKVVWKNAIVHFMNMPQIKAFLKGIPFNICDEYGILLARACSFASVLINTQAVKKAGLPLKEFFIWTDDIEYTERITANGFLGLYIIDSIVLHNTKENYNTNIYLEKRINAWKYYYGTRNVLYHSKTKGFIYYFFYLMYNLTIKNLKILKLRQDSRWKFIWMNTKGSLAAFLFNPKVEKIN